MDVLDAVLLLQNEKLKPILNKAIEIEDLRDLAEFVELLKPFNLKWSNGKPFTVHTSRYDGDGGYSSTRSCYYLEIENGKIRIFYLTRSHAINYKYNLINFERFKELYHDVESEGGIICNGPN